MTDELKPAPCPWCKGRVVQVRAKDSDKLWVSHRARCVRRNCDAIGPARKTPDGAIKAWNRIAEVHRGS